MPRVGGLIGLNTDAWVKQIMDAESYPLQMLADRRKGVEVKKLTWQAVKSSLDSMRSKLDGLRFIGAFDLRKATSSEPTVADVAVSSGTATGSHSLTVTTLAATHSIGSAQYDSPSTALGLSGTALMNGQSLAIVATDTLNTVRDKINAISGIGVTASLNSATSAGVTKYQLVLTSTSTGKAGEIKLADSSSTVTSSNIAVADVTLTSGGKPVAGTYTMVVAKTVAADGTAQLTINGAAYTRTSDTALADLIQGTSVDLHAAGTTTVAVAPNGVLNSLGLLTSSGGYATQFTAAQDAKFNIDGTDYTRTQNVVTDALPGLTLTLKKGSGATTNINVDKDTDGVVNSIGAFVDEYNKLLGTLTDQTAYSSDTKKGGLLNGDSLARQIRNELKSMVSDVVPGLPQTMSTLSQIGITTGKWGTADYGKLVLDRDKLRTQLLNDQNGVAQVFASTGGIATHMFKTVDNAVMVTSGSLAIKDDGFKSTLKDIDDKISKMQTRLTQREKDLRERFTKMEMALVRLKGSGASLLDQLPQMM